MNTNELYELVRTHDDARSNLPRMRRAMSMTDAGRMDTGDLWEYPINDWAMGQLCKSMEIPAAFLRRCPLDLRVTIINRFLQDSKDRELVLCMANRPSIVGVVSSRYSTYPYTEFVEDAHESYSSIPGGCIVDGLHLDDKSLDYNVIFPLDRTIVNPANEEAQQFTCGVHFRNSDVGYSAAIAAAVIRSRTHRWTIGVDRLIGMSFVREVHVGGHEEFRNDTKALVESLVSNWDHLLEVYAATMEFTITVGNIRDLIRSHSLAKDILDGRLGVEVFSSNTNVDDRHALSDIISGIAIHADTRVGQAKWNLQRICGSIILDFQDSLEW